MAADVGELDGLHETSYVFVSVLGRGAFGEAVLYRKTEVPFKTNFKRGKPHIHLLRNLFSINRI